MPKPETLPCNLEAERAVIGSLLGRGGEFRVLSGVLDADDFYLEAHRRIWHAMEGIARVGGHIEPAAVTVYLRDQGQLESVGGLSSLIGMDDGLGEIFGGEQYARTVKEHSIRRRGILACQKFQDELMLGGESAEVLTRAESVIRDLNASTAQDRRLRTAGEIIVDRGGLSAFLKRSAETGIPTRFPSLNRIIGGFKPEEQWIIAARPSVGKTSLATDILEHAGAHGICGAMFSLEMPSDQLILRMACSRSRTDWTRYRDNVLRREERQGIGIATAEIAEMPVVFDDTAACTVAGIHAAITRYNAIRPVGLVVVDYLQLMESTGRHNSQNDAVAAMSRGLKLAAKQFKIPFIVLSQLTRGPEADKRRPKLSDLRDSGAIEQNADGVIFLHPTDEGYGPMRQVKLIVAKQRNGPTAEMAMLFHRPYARFEEAIPTEAEDAA